MAVYTFHNYVAFEYGIASSPDDHTKTAKWGFNEGYDNIKYSGPLNEKLLTKNHYPWTSLVTNL